MLIKPLVHFFRHSSTHPKSLLKDNLTDPRAHGLKVLNGSGYTDNPGLGISVIENGNTEVPV